MTYRLLIVRAAQKELGSLPLDAYERVKRAIRDLSDSPRPAGSRKLVSRDGWRIRIGSYRVIYEIDDTLHAVTILHVGHRGDIYR